MSEKTEFAKGGYDVKVIGRHIPITDAIKQYAVDKVSKIDRFHSRVLEVVVILEVQKLVHLVDIILKVDHTKIKSHYAGDNLYASIDFAVDKLKRQLARYRSRIKDHHASARSIVDMRVNVFKAPEEVHLADVNDQIDEENRRKIEDSLKPRPIVSRETLPLKTLTLDEAIWQLELSGDPFMIFKSEETQKIKVIYRREEDGNFGVVEPEA